MGRQERYMARKLAGLCVECKAGLTDEDTSVRCLECRERHVRSQLKYATKISPDVARERARLAREARRARGLCTRCGAVRPPAEHVVCRSCARHESRGVRKSKISVTELRAEYRPLDELKRKPRVRLLTALAWLDWADTSQIFQAANIAEGGEDTEHNTAQVTLGRLVRHGLVERRVLGGRVVNADYRITAAGRAEVARYRAGDFR